jgi:hypothetical protein
LAAALIASNLAPQREALAELGSQQSCISSRTGVYLPNEFSDES